MLLTWGLLSVMYYWPILLAGGFWWLLVGMRAKGTAV